MTPPQPANLDDAQQVINEQVETIHEQVETIVTQRRQIDWLNRQLFGRKSEKLLATDHPLFEGLDEPPSASTPSTEPDTETVTYARKRPTFCGGRGEIPDDLPRVDRIYDLPEHEKVCPQTGAGLVKKIGEDISEQLAYEPASIYVIRHIRYRYAKLEENLDGTSPEVVTAAKPPEGLPKCLAAPSLLAAVGKFADHTPLYRLEKIFKRSGVVLSRSTMCRWMQGVGQLCEPVLDLMKRRILASKVIQSDDTAVKQQAPGQCKTCRFWSYVGDGGDPGGHPESDPYVIYDYTPDRSRAGPEAWFTDDDGSPLFAGHLQCDAYSGYTAFFDAVSTWSMTHLGCWAHVRRKFYDIRMNFPAEAHGVLAKIRQLYQVEKQAKSLKATMRQPLRQEKAKPIVDAIFTWCQQHKTHVMPKSGLGEAIGYTLNLEASLRRYLDDGDFQIDNNACERSLRGVAIGRKNWMFTGSPAGGQAAAAILSLIATCQLHTVEPLAYLTDLITRLPSTPSSQIDQFLPEAWKTTHGQR
mgnify:CR=1 FL=1